MSVNLYTNILIIVSVTLLVTTRFHTWINFAILGVVTFLSYIVFLIIVHNWAFFNSVGTMAIAFSSPVFILNVFLICGLCGLIEFFILSFNFIFNPDIVAILKRIIDDRGKIDTKDNLPKIILDKINIYDSIEEKFEEPKNMKQEIEIEKETLDKNKDIEIEEFDKKSNGQNNINDEDEVSQAIFLKKSISRKSTSNEININILNMSNNKGKISNSEYYGENLTDSYSEKMSKENNLLFTNNNYYIEKTDFQIKIMHRKI